MTKTDRTIGRGDILELLIITIILIASIVSAQEFNPAVGGSRKLLAPMRERITPKPQKTNPKNLPRKLCPNIPARDGCECSGNPGRITVDCTNKGLTRVPAGLPKKTRLLRLDNNNIQEITANDFKGLKKLETLHLNGNLINVTEEWAFKDLYSLKVLYLDNNRITQIGSDMIRHLPSLEQIHLTNNSISTIAPNAFNTLPKLNEVYLKDNPLKCDCNLKKFRDWRDKYRSAPVSKILYIYDGYCDGQEFVHVDDNVFGSCDGDQSSGEDNISCYTCKDKVSNEQCTTDEQQCDQREACQSTINVTAGEITLSKACSNYTDCLAKTEGNAVTCRDVGPDMVCNFCCQEDSCNYEDFGEKIEFYSYELTFRMEGIYSSVFETGQPDVKHRKMISVKTVLMDSLKGLNATFYIDKIDFSEPNITANIRLVATVLKGLDRSALNMWYMINDALVIAAASGPLRTEKVVKNSIRLDSLDLCEPETRGKLEWKLSLADTEEEIPCPDDQSKTAKRTCKMDNDGIAAWDEPDDDDCPHEMSDITRELADIRSTEITTENLNILSLRLKNVSLRCPEYTDQDVEYTVDIIVHLLDQVIEEHQGDTISNCVTTLSNMFAVPLDTLVMAEQNTQAANRYLQAIENFTSHVNLTGSVFKEVRPNLAIVVSPLNISQFDGLRIEADHPTGELSGRNAVKIGDDLGTISETKDNIVLPRSIFSDVQGEHAPGADRASFVIYRNDMFFQALEKTRQNSTAPNVAPPRTRVVSKNASSPVVRVQSDVNSRVMAASIGNLKIANLREPVLITFRHTKQQGYKQPNCVYWDSVVNEGAGGWSNNGCHVNESVENSYTVCACNHLTNFALLMDIYATGESIDAANAYALTVISYVGCAISFFGLVLTIVAHSMFGIKKLRKNKPSKILLNLCVALAAVNVTFVAGIYALENPLLCKVVAALLHYFLLASMLWMCVEAFYMYVALVRIFNTSFPGFIFKCALIGWGIPVLIVIITLGVNSTDNYGSQTGNQICWLNQTAFYAAFLAPVGLILLLNFVAFGLVTHQIMGMSSEKLSRSETAVIARRLKGIVGVVILLGLTWVFAIFAIGKASLVFSYLFAIFNSLQGLFVFLFFCLLQKDAQRKLLCCLASSSDISSHKMSSKGTSHTTAHTRGRFKAAVNAVRAANYLDKRDSNSSSEGSTGSDRKLHTRNSSTSI